MSFRLRAVRALTLLVGFHLMGVALLSAIAVFDRLLMTRLFTARAAWFEGMVLTVTALLAAAILRGLFAFLRAGRLGPVPHGVAVTPQDQPELWGQIQAAAEVTGQRPPNEVYLIAEVNAGVAEQSRLLGLLPGRRRMLLGLPLLGGPTVPQLRAVLAHEFGHYGNLDTRLGAVTMRGREALLHTVEVFQEGSTRLHHAIGALYVGYARMFLRTSQSVARHQELAADQTAARHAGRDATAAALRVVPVLAATYTHYLETYAAMGRSLGALPPEGEVHGGFRRLLAARTGEQLALLSSGQRPPRPHQYDSHPPIAERIALIEKLPTDGRPDDATDEPAARSLVVGGVLVAQGPQPAGQLGELEGVPAEHVDVVAHERRESGDGLVAALEAVGRELAERGVHVAGGTAAAGPRRGSGGGRCPASAGRDPARG